LPPLEASESPDKQPIAPSSYKQSSLEEERLTDAYERLTQLMTEAELYRLPELTLATVAAQMGLHPHTLSEVINRSTGQHFFDYINTWRVQTFKARIARGDYKHYTLLALAFECGFNSKTAFNRNFKNLMGQSPSQYLKAQTTASAPLAE
jgi:AraC-like DNA-binding protein